ncbi:Peroxiredoxin [Desulfacinum hydrothermale DSM 13146]|uniref:Peroxiredoxin n=1 Tax=Desulfacinum hydrothermale DSM 13146 TaxID=1121390 RepID=A0A1W1WXP1_9BACT|nr:TlpA disulfide reductase family protein [Desulfacinum hydrothermale]SMC16363.1 Peroxiredoxin [Desulfacinum hydrothermale DSM 13146]
MRKVLQSVGVVLVTAVLVAGTGSVASAESMMEKVLGLVGAGTSAEAADFELPAVDGSRVRLSDFRGKKPVLLYFWALWCPACRAMKPEVAELRHEISDDRLEILAINVGSGESFTKVKRYQKAHPMPFKVLYDGNSTVTQAYGVRGIPLLVIVDKEGKVVYRDHQLPGHIERYLD